MKKLFKTIATVIFITILFSTLSACSTQKKIVGKWIDNATGDIYHFYDAVKGEINECEIYSNSGTVDDLFFKIDNKRIYYIDASNNVNQIYEYKINGDTLTFSRGGEIEMTFTNANDIPTTPKPTQIPEATKAPTTFVTPLPTPTVFGFTAEQLNNYYVEYSEIKDGKKTTTIEASFASITFISTDGGKTYTTGQSSLNLLCNTLFSKHLIKTDYENKGTETVASRICTHYYDAETATHFYVDETFATTGICLKYVEEGGSTIEISQLKFGVINNEPGYEIVNFQSKLG